MFLVRKFARSPLWFAYASKEGGQPILATPLLRVYFLKLKNRGNRGTVIGIGINSLEYSVVVVIYSLYYLAFSLA